MRSSCRTCSLHQMSEVHTPAEAFIKFTSAPPTLTSESMSKALLEQLRLLQQTPGHNRLQTPCYLAAHQCAIQASQSHTLSQLKMVHRPHPPAATKEAEAPALSADTDRTVPTLTMVQAATVDVITFCISCTHRAWGQAESGTC